MTSLAFILGVLPLVFASGAGQEARHSVGTAVAGGMFVSTFLNIVFIPILYVVVRSVLRGGRTEAAGGGVRRVEYPEILDSVEIRVVRCPVYFFGSTGCPERAPGVHAGHGGAAELSGAVGSATGPRVVEGWRRAAMQIDERVVEGVMILDLKGKMTLGEGDELLKDKINSLIQQDQKKLLLNLEGVPYIDSAGLGEIVRTYTTVSRQGGKLKLLNLTKRIQDLLAITKLLTVFETYEDESEAVKSFGN